MTEISATIRLRPTRIGFLVRPTDMASILKIMRICTCLWGGIYNPIIPVFKRPPEAWRPEPHERVKGLAVAKGYINFFEPDVFVEAEEGLLEESGLGALRKEHQRWEQVKTLDEFLSPMHHEWSEPAFGLSIYDVLKHLYETEQRFQLREKRPAVFVQPKRNNGLVEALFGVYPKEQASEYFVKGYQEVLRPDEVEANPNTWLKVFSGCAYTPLQMTDYELEIQPVGRNDLHIYVFDPSKPTDLIDLWNLRIEEERLVPVPVEWLEALTEHLCKLINDEYRPIRGNPYGTMHHSFIEFGRSIGKEHAQELIGPFLNKVPKEAFWTHSRSRIWVKHVDDRIHRNQRLLVTAKERKSNLVINKEDQELRGSFETLAPEFAFQYEGDENRWVNAVTFSFLDQEKAATVFPFNNFDRSWPLFRGLGDHAIVNSEGWVFGQKFKNWNESIKLLSKEEALFGFFKKQGIEAKLLHPGQVAKQMLEHLGGLREVILLADPELLKLLNNMAGGIRVKKNDAETVEEKFELRSAPIADWSKLIPKLKKRFLIQWLELADFTKRNIIRLGSQTECPHCQAKNWHSLTSVDYRLTCERCLNNYEFPQAGLRKNNQNWTYRVVGPFSVPDYGRGAYSTLLTLRFFKTFGGSHNEMTFSTALDLKFDNTDMETDFAAFWRDDKVYGFQESPVLVIGETKSFGEGELIKAKDLTQLKKLGTKFPGAVIVISVLRNDFTPLEKELLSSFVKWCRRLDESGQPTNPVILLTGHELFTDYLKTAWEKLGKPHSDFSELDHLRNLYSLADATQQIYLSLPSFDQWRTDDWKKRVARKKALAKR
ncbi:MAG: hypothetical protein AB7T49_21510 [Oligoflexales bacterium]